MDSELITIYWRDIPSQVSARQGKDRASIELDRRFASAIDRAAMNSGMSGSDEYLQHWEHRSRECGPDLWAEVEAEAGRLDSEYPSERLERIIASGGIDEELKANPGSSD